VAVKVLGIIDMFSRHKNPTMPGFTSVNLRNVKSQKESCDHIQQIPTLASFGGNYKTLQVRFGDFVCPVRYVHGCPWFP